MAAVEFRLPKLGMAVLEGTVVEWMVAEGDTVSEGQEMLLVEMDKAETPLPSPVAGKVVELVAAAGETVDVGALLARIEVDGAP